MRRQTPGRYHLFVSRAANHQQSASQCHRKHRQSDELAPAKHTSNRTTRRHWLATRPVGTRSVRASAKAADKGSTFFEGSAFLRAVWTGTVAQRTIVAFTAECRCVLTEKMVPDLQRLTNGTTLSSTVGTASANGSLTSTTAHPFLINAFVLVHVERRYHVIAAHEVPPSTATRQGACSVYPVTRPTAHDASR